MQVDSLSSPEAQSRGGGKSIDSEKVQRGRWEDEKVARHGYSFSPVSQLLA